MEYVCGDETQRATVCPKKSMYDLYLSVRMSKKKETTLSAAFKCLMRSFFHWF